MHFDELLPIYELFQIIFIDIDSFLALAAMTITKPTIRKKFESFTVSKLSLLYTHLVHFTITQRPTVTRSGSLTQHSPWFRQQLAARRAPDDVKHDCLNALEAQSIASGQEQEDTPVKSRSFRSVSVSDPS